MGTSTPKKNLYKPDLGEDGVADEYAAAMDILDNAVLDTLVTAAGQLLVATASGVLSTLGVGSVDQVLVADPAASTKMAWKTIQSTGVIVPFFGAATALTPGASIGNRPAAGSASVAQGGNQFFDLTGYSEVRLALQTTVAFEAGTKITLIYSSDGGTNWNYLESSGTALEMDGAVTDSNTAILRKSAWTALAAGARDEVDLRAVFYNTDASPASGTIRHLHLIAR